MAASDNNPGEFVDFGFDRVSPGEKQRRVRGVFDSVAHRYDRPGQSALDVAAGSGDLSEGMARQVGSAGRVVVTDINGRMLGLGRSRMIDAGLVANIHYLQADAERLPVSGSAFDCVSIGFGLRNVTDKDAALAEMFRVLRPGGRLLVLEFSRPKLELLDSAYEYYCLKVTATLRSRHAFTRIRKRSSR